MGKRQCDAVPPGTLGRFLLSKKFLGGPPPPPPPKFFFKSDNATLLKPITLHQSACCYSPQSPKNNKKNAFCARAFFPSILPAFAVVTGRMHAWIFRNLLNSLKNDAQRQGRYCQPLANSWCWRVPAPAKPCACASHRLVGRRSKMPSAPGAFSRSPLPTRAATRRCRHRIEQPAGASRRRACGWAPFHGLAPSTARCALKEAGWAEQFRFWTGDGNQSCGWSSGSSVSWGWTKEPSGHRVRPSSVDQRSEGEGLRPQHNPVPLATFFLTTMLRIYQGYEQALAGLAWFSEIFFLPDCCCAR